MSTVVTHAPGTFCWVELGTIDADAAKSFYTQLFGWDAEDTEAGPDSVYTMLHHDGRTVGGLYGLNDEQRAQGVPPHWLPYAAVTDASDAAARTKDLGGTVVVEPFDVMEHGRMAVLQDPTGATFAVWEARAHSGADALNEPGTVCWTELATPDSAAAEAFYTGLFDWNTHTAEMDQGPYTSFMRGETPTAGMLQMTDEWEGIPPNWMTYFGVADCEASCAKAKALGGQVNVGPIPVDGVGTFAVIQDPQGGIFSIIQMDSFG